MTDHSPVARRATPADLDAVTAVVTSAFAADPLWSHALSDAGGRPLHQADFWGILVGGALRYPWIWLAPASQAVAVWIPPGGEELLPEEAGRLLSLVERLLGDRATDVLELLERSAAAHPHDRPHYYLSLLGTHQDHRGNGIGMGLLGSCLDQIDAEHMPAYLESSNPANDERYRRVGFEAVGGFTFPHGGPVVTTMWRQAR